MDSLKDAEAERAKEQGDQYALNAEKIRLERDIKLGRLFAKRRVLAGKVNALGTVAAISDDAANARVAAERTLTTTEHQLNRLAEELVSLHADVDAAKAIVNENAPLDAIDADDFQRRRGEAASLRAETTKAEDERLRAAQTLARSSTQLADAPAITIAALLELEAAVPRLTLEIGRDEERAAQQTVQITRIRSELAALSDPAKGDAPAFRVSELRAALAEAEAILPTLAELPSLENDLARAAAQIKALAHIPENASAPPSSVLDAFAREHDVLFRRSLELENELLIARTRTAQVTIDLAPLTSALSPPSEEDLQRARSDRDALLDAGALGGPALRAAIPRADALVDHMRRESDRVALRARLIAERAALAAQTDSATDAQKRVQNTLLDLEARFARAFRGVPATEIREARALGEAVEHVHQQRLLHTELAARIQLIREQETNARALLVGGLAHGVAGVPTEEKGVSLRVLSSHARDALSASTSFELIARDRGERRRALLESEREQESALAAVIASQSANAKAWAIALTTLGLEGAAPETAATQRLADWRALLNARDAAKNLETRIDSLRAQSAELSAFTMRLYDTLHLAEEADAEQRAVTIGRRLRALGDAKHALEKKSELLRLKTAQKRDLDADRADAQKTIEAALRHAGVTTRDELPRIEAKAKEKAVLEREVLELDLRVAELGGDPNAEEGEAEASRAEGRLSHVEAELERIDHELPKLHQRIGGERKGLYDFDHKETLALESSLDAEQELAKVVDLAARYCRLVVAGMLLDERIEAHRAASENDVLLRASDLVRKITANSIHGLRESWDETDRPVLVCVRADGRETPVSGLSDGTKDSLYLALRIASLERIAKTALSLPVLLDDVLVHFDDDRARVALEVIAELAASTQVIFFTHHKRIVELAEAALPASALAKISLGA